MNRKSIGNKLKFYRVQNNISIKECAEKVGISTRYLADIERGDKVPKLETFIQILNALSASADVVLQDSLVIGYESKSNDIIQKLSALDVSRRKQALDIFDSVISSLQEK